MPRAYGEIAVLQNAASANGNGQVADTQGATAVLLEVNETNGGTGTLALQGSFDGDNWFAVGYELVSNTAAPARAVANISVTANLKAVYAVLDLYPLLRAVLSGVLTSPVITARVYTVGA